VGEGEDGPKGFPKRGGLRISLGDKNPDKSVQARKMVFFVHPGKRGGKKKSQRSGVETKRTRGAGG